MGVLDMFRPEGKALTIGISSSCGLGFLLFGYDQGVFGGLLANRSFQETFNHPDTTLEGQIVSTYTLGCIFGATASIFLGDILGRRKSVYLGCTLLTVGGILQATAYSLGHMIVGRVIGGLGVGVNTTVIPMWQSETSRPGIRGRLVAFELTALVLGFVVTNWMNFGFTYIDTQQISWRFPLGFQSALALGTMGFIPFLVESPRWLCLKDRQTEARAVIARLQAKPIDHEDVHEAYEIMRSNIEHERAEGQISFRGIFQGGPQQTFRRILLGAGANFMQQIGGVNVVAYYLPVVLQQSFGFSYRMSLVLSACDSMQWMFWAACAMWTIERFGRKRLMLFGAAGQVLCFGMTAVGLGIGGEVMNGVAVAFIFLYYFFYGLSFLAIPFLYPSEINPSRSRAVGAGIAMVTNWLGVYIVVSITPIGIESIGWRFYIVFAVLNAVWIPFIWFFYVETAGLSLEEIDRVFELKYAEGAPKMTYKEATVKAKEGIETERLLISQRQDYGASEKSSNQHVEEKV